MLPMESAGPGLLHLIVPHRPQTPAALPGDYGTGPDEQHALHSQVALGSADGQLCCMSMQGELVLLRLSPTHGQADP